MTKNLKRQEGFTIIEVMIVLVIAAVILLIVFLAVPALQRNSRNTQRKNDVAGQLSGINEWVTNNGGAMPVAVNDTAATAASSGHNTGAAFGNAKMGYYTTNANIILKGNKPSANPATAPTTDEMFVYTDATCTNATTVGTQNRGVAILYSVETGGGSSVVCQSS